MICFAPDRLPPRLLLLLGLLAACQSAPGPADVAKSEPDPAPSVAAPERAPVEPSPEPEPQPAPGKTCEAPTIVREAGMRDGLPDGTDECRAVLQRIRAALETAPACQSDGQCTMVSLGGGCLGAPLPEAVIEPLPEACVPASCADADFTDHEVRCDDGCCAVYET